MFRRLVEQARAENVVDSDRGKCRQVTYAFLERIRWSAHNIFFLRTISHPILGEHTAALVHSEDGQWVAVDGAAIQTGSKNEIRIHIGNTPEEAIELLTDGDYTFDQQIIGPNSYVSFDPRSIIY